jgi:hypothetical protein
MYKLRLIALAGVLVLADACTGLTETKIGNGIGVKFSPRVWQPVGKPKIGIDLVQRTGGRLTAHAVVTVEARRDHAEAMERLREIAAEEKDPSQFVLIDGWPAMVRRRVAPLPLPGVEDSPKESDPFEGKSSTRVTVAIAGAARLLRLEATLSPDADPALANEVEAIGRSLHVPEKSDPAQSAKELAELRASPLPRRTPPAIGPSHAMQRGGGPAPGAPVVGRAGNGELEIAASNNGQNVVIGSNPGTVHSTDGGLTYVAATTPTTFPRDGDPSLAVGASGNFYYSFIGFPNGTPAALNVTGTSDSLAVSTDGGATFNLVSHAVLCTAAAGCFPDQEHIAADRVNTGAGGGDQIYLVYRNFLVGVTPTIVCSSDSGATWPISQAIGAGDLPRVSVGRDGFVYAVWLSGGNIMINKYSSCQSGLVAQAGFPVTVSAFTPVNCPVAGLDRCDGRNTLESPTVAVDDLDSTHVFVVFATNTSASNENVVVFDSSNGGATWPRTATVNTAVTGRRVMPWSCVYGGTAQIAWYDRRAATAASNDLTGYFRASAAVKGGNLTSFLETNVAGVNDPECGNFWPAATNASTDAESCSVQPQLAGRCAPPAPAAATSGSQQACDFSSTVCATPGEICRNNRGAPKYGDYNGIACAAGRVYTAWASATVPAGLVAPGANIDVYSSADFIPSDFYVRDWTLAGGSDDGREPSISPGGDFWDWSDVWVQPGPSSTPTIPAANAAPPPNETVNVGTGTAGDNYVFARVSRRAPAAPTAAGVDAQLQFSWADWGAGTNFFDIGSPTPLPFAAGDNMKTLSPGVLWHLDSTMTTHICMAVELTALNDDEQAPPLNGTPSAGSRMVDDNNKAQRNLTAQSGPGSGSEFGAAVYAIIENPDVVPHDMTVRVLAPEKTLPPLGTPRLEAIGGEQLPANRELRLKAMQPGEKRWVGFTWTPPALQPGTVRQVSFAAFADGKLVNGFGVAIHGAALDDLLRHVLRELRAVFARGGAVFRFADADKEVAAADQLLARKSLTGQEFEQFVTQRLAAERMLLARLEESHNAHDPFGAAVQVAEVVKALATHNAEAIAVAQGTLLGKLESFETRLQRADGDLSEIEHDVRWQEYLYRMRDRDQSARAIVERSAEFVTAWHERKVGVADYPRLIESLMPALESTAKKLDPRGTLGQLVAAMAQDMSSPAALERDHRVFLLKLQSLP